ncbi:hypothetical protein QZH41_001404 [Actinostola sp. cb2023]|nr:hypothetical protein QZH41_001404 [Actinostola sp. cb2023]
MFPRASTFATREEPEPHTVPTQHEDESSSAYVAKERNSGCYLCSKDHRLTRCELFKNKSYDERCKFVRWKGLCYNCLNPGHRSDACPKESFCRVTGCKFTRKHSTFLHPQEKPVRTETQTKQESTQLSKPSEEGERQPSKNANNSTNGLCSSIGAGRSITGLAIVPVKVKAKDKDKVIETYAFLDQGSNTSFCTERLVRRLGAITKPTTLSLTTMDHENFTSESSLVSLEVYDVNETNLIELPIVYSRPKLPVSTKDIPQQTDVDRWSHLAGIKLNSIDAQIDILIRNDVPKAHEPQEVRPSCSVRTQLELYLDGPLMDRLGERQLSLTLQTACTQIFRKESVAMMSDIESIFYQVHVRPDDSKFLRYLWWPDGDLNRDPEEFQMLVHLFGGISSPSCASYALQRTADDNATKYDKETIYTIRNNFYVDDCLKSVENRRQSASTRR